MAETLQETGSDGMTCGLPRMNTTAETSKPLPSVNIGADKSPAEPFLPSKSPQPSSEQNHDAESAVRAVDHSYREKIQFPEDGKEKEPALLPERAPHECNTLKPAERDSIAPSTTGLEPSSNNVRNHRTTLSSQEAPPDVKAPNGLSDQRKPRLNCKQSFLKYKSALCSELSKWKDAFETNASRAPRHDFLDHYIHASQRLSNSDMEPEDYQDLSNEATHQEPVLRELHMNQPQKSFVSAETPLSRTAHNLHLANETPEASTSIRAEQGTPDMTDVSVTANSLGASAFVSPRKTAKFDALRKTLNIPVETLSRLHREFPGVHHDAVPVRRDRNKKPKGQVVNRLSDESARHSGEVTRYSKIPQVGYVKKPIRRASCIMDPPMDAELPLLRHVASSFDPEKPSVHSSLGNPLRVQLSRPGFHDLKNEPEFLTVFERMKTVSDYSDVDQYAENDTSHAQPQENVSVSQVNKVDPRGQAREGESCFAVLTVPKESALQEDEGADAAMFENDMETQDASMSSSSDQSSLQTLLIEKGENEEAHTLFESQLKAENPNETLMIISSEDEVQKENAICLDKGHIPSPRPLSPCGPDSGNMTFEIRKAEEPAQRQAPDQENNHPFENQSNQQDGDTVAVRSSEPEHSNEQLGSDEFPSEHVTGDPTGQAEGADEPKHTTNEPRPAESIPLLTCKKLPPSPSLCSLSSRDGSRRGPTKLHESLDGQRPAFANVQTLNITAEASSPRKQPVAVALRSFR